jgi:uncharacterized protein YeaO (DUF488 family)
MRSARMSMTNALPKAAVGKGRPGRILLKRAYDPASPADGRRFLVERLWPRGVTKSRLNLDGWLKDVAPSTALRLWFDHAPQKWTRFRERYFAELRTTPPALRELLAAARDGRITLVFSSRDTKHNNAVALRQLLERRLARR